MKTFPTGFTAEKNKKTGTLAVWILRLTVEGIDYWISAGVYTIPPGGPNWPAPAAVTTLTWVAAWGAIRESIGGGIGEILIADFTVSLLTDQDAGTNIDYLASTYELEQEVCQLWLWYDGLNALTDPPQMMFSGNVADLDIPDDTGVTLSIEDEAARIQQYLGTRISREAYPLCDPDVVGKVIPIPFGNVKNLPALCVDAGWVTSLVKDITATQTMFMVSEWPSYDIRNKTIVIEDEEILIQHGGAADGYNSEQAFYSTGLWATHTAPNRSVEFVRDWDDRSDNAVKWWEAGVPPGPGVGLGVTFDSLTKCYAMVIVSLQDTWPATVPVTPALTGVNYVVQDFDVYYLVADGGDYILAASVRNNNKIQCYVSFDIPPCKYLHINILRQPDNVARVVEWSPHALFNGRLIVQRGVNGTTPQIHNKGAMVIEKKTTPLVYLCSDRVLSGIGRILARVRGINVDITSDCTKYLGTPANQHPTYPGKGCITIPDIAKVEQRISLELANTLSVSQGSHTHASSPGVQQLRPNRATNVSGGTAANNYNSTYAQNCWDGNAATYMDGVMQADHAQTTPYYNYDNSYYEDMVCFNYTTVNNIANCLRIRVGVLLETNANYGGKPPTVFLFIKGAPVIVHALNYVNGKATYYTGYVPFTNPADLYNNLSSWAGINLVRTTGFKLYEIWFEIETGTPTPYSEATGVALKGNLGLTGNSVADIAVGDQILVDVTRNITTPAAVIGDLLATYANDTSLQQIGTLPSHFQLSGAITEYKRLLEWLDYLAWQCGCYFRRSCGVSKLIVRTASLVSQKEIPACCLDSEGKKRLKRKKASLSDVVNTIDLLYGRDWSSSNRQAESYTRNASGTDPISVANYGPRERPDQFMFDFVTSSQMAGDLVSLYLALYGPRPWRVSFFTFLDHCELEFGDCVTLDFLNFLVGQIVEAALIPGDADNMDSIEFTVLSPTIPQAPLNSIITAQGDPMITKDRRFIIYAGYP